MRNELNRHQAGAKERHFHHVSHYSDGARVRIIGSTLLNKEVGLPS